MKFKYLEIIERGTETVVLRMDVSSQSDRNIERTENGMNINLNHADYYTKLNESETELELISD